MAETGRSVGGGDSSGGNGSWLDAPELRKMLGAEDCRGGEAPGRVRPRRHRGAHVQPPLDPLHTLCPALKRCNLRELPTAKVTMW